MTDEKSPLSANTNESRKNEALFEKIVRLFWKEPFRIDENGCWNWTRRTIPNGYGQMYFIGEGNRRTAKYAHRISWLIHFGAIPTGMHVCHRCDNPRCCNPWHMFLGTPAENARDRKAKGRNYQGKRKRFDRNRIREMLNAGRSIREIACEMGAHRTTIEKAVRRHALKDSTGGSNG